MVYDDWPGDRYMIELADWIEASRNKRQVYYRYHAASELGQPEYDEDYDLLWSAKNRALERLKGVTHVEMDTKIPD